MEGTVIDLEVLKMQAEINKMNAEEIFVMKKARWYELIIFGSGGITIGLALAKIFSN